MPVPTRTAIQTASACWLIHFGDVQATFTCHPRPICPAVDENQHVARVLYFSCFVGVENTNVMSSNSSTGRAGLPAASGEFFSDAMPMVVLAVVVLEASFKDKCERMQLRRQQAGRLPRTQKSTDAS
jgi:hypothetical protein